MEDTVILKQHYMYMFRWDAEASELSQKFMIEQFEELGITNWIGKAELGETTNKPHYQMAVWCEHKKTEKEKDLVRKRFKRSKYTHKSKGSPCAMKSARKITSLVSYCLKEDGTSITNLNKELLNKIPKWKNKNAEKVIFNEKVEKHVEALHGSKRKKVESIIEFYVENNVMPPSRGRMLFLLLKYRHITIQTYRYETYNFKMFSEYGTSYDNQDDDDYDENNYIIKKNVLKE